VVEFSIVCPIKDEVDLIPKTLLSFYAVNPSEVVLCVDRPAPKEVVDIVDKVAKGSKAEDMTRIIEVGRNPDYAFHQAWVRRKGFLEATHDRILTTDIDLILNKNVLKGVELVGNDDIGLVSCSKFYSPRGLGGLWRAMAHISLSRLVYPLWRRYRGEGLKMSTFTGLYALWRPYWLDSEDEGIKSLENPKTALRRGEEPVVGEKVCMGEDTYLRDCMEKCHKIVYLRDVGAFSIGRQLQDHPHVQFERGRYYLVRGRSTLGAIFTSVVRIQPHYLRGYLYERERVIKRDEQIETKPYSLSRAREYWRFAPTSIGTSKASSEELLSKPEAYIKNLINRSIEERNIKQGAMVYRRRVSEWIKRAHVKNMLDFGCGVGQDGVYFSKKLKIKVTFADIVKSNVELTSKYSRIWDIQANSIYVDRDPESFAFPETYDLIFANGVLHHSPDARQIVANLKKFSDTWSLFICMLYTPKHFKSTRAKTLEEYARLSEARSRMKNPYSDYYDLGKAKKLFEDFSLIDHWTTHNGKFGWYVFKKMSLGDFNSGRSGRHVKL